MLDSSNDAFFVHDAHTLNILDVNQRMCELYGYTREEAKHVTIEDISQGQPPWSQTEAVVWLQKARQIGPQTFEWLAKRKNGELFWSEVSLRFALFDTGERYVVTIRDISHRKRSDEEKSNLEAQNRQLQKAESLGRMAGAIAHHFNNQLQTVMMSLDLAQGDLARGTNPALSLIEAMQAARRASEISALMLTYLGQSHGRKDRLDIAEICRQSLPLLQLSMPKKTELKTDLPSPGPFVVSDASQIRQILANILTNAWEAIGDGNGTIHLNVRTVLASEIPTTYRFPAGWQDQDNSSYACVEIADTGTGIARVDIEKVFDPFFSSKFTGRGLGLPVVLGIVRAHAGVVTVESEPGLGSVFRVFLPTVQGALAPSPRPCVSVPVKSRTEVSEAASSGTILLVEDETSLRKVAANALSGLGFTVISARDGVEAVELFKAHLDEIRLVLCDLTMPRMDGWETLTALRRFSPFIPVILSSGYDEAHVMAGNHPEKPQAFLSKPYEFDVFCDTIFRVLKMHVKAD